MDWVNGLVLGALVALLFGLASLALALRRAPRSKPVRSQAQERSPSTIRDEALNRRPAAIQQEARERPHSSKIKARSAAEVKKLVETFTQAKVLKIYDGDTLLVAKGWSRVMIRLDSIDCPEDGQDWGDTAKHGLIKLVGGRTVHLEQYGADDYGRTLATVYVRHANGRDWINVNEQMVSLGHAWIMVEYYDHLPIDRQSRLHNREAWAKENRVGLWKTPNPMPPWQWRREIWQPPPPSSRRH